MHSATESGCRPRRSARLDRLYEEDPLALLRERWAFVFRTLNDNHQWRQIMEIVFHRCELVTESGEIRERILLSRGEGTSTLPAC